VPVRAISALEDKGVAEIWDDVARFRAALEATGAWVQRRRDQARAALWSEIDVRLIEHFRACSALAARLAEIEAWSRACALPQMPPAPWSRPFSASGDLPHLAARD
jgi:LAO/AO transport system kinase